MEAFRCQICNEAYPMSLHHLHHKMPKALGGSDEPDNLVNLCQADHNLLHTIAYMIVNKKRRHEIEPTLASMYPDSPQVRKAVLEYAMFAAREMALKKEIKKDSTAETRLTIELPQLYLELLRLAAYDMPRKNGKPIGTSSFIRVLLAEFLSKKFPMKREEILSLKRPKK